MCEKDGVMKKILFCALVSAALAFVSVSCKSAKVSLEEYSPVAIMTVYSNRGVSWYSETAPSESSENVEDGILTGLVNRAFDKDNPEVTLAQERIDFASALFSEKLRSACLEVIDPTSVKDCPAYKKAGKNFVDYLNSTLPAAGYDAMTSRSVSLNKKVSKETGAQCLLYVKFRFQKEKVKKGVHTVGVAARTSLTVYGTDAKGHSIVNKTYSGTSSGYAEYNGSSWDRDFVCGAFAEATEIAVNKFIADYTGNVDGGSAKGQVLEPAHLSVPSAKSGAGQESAAEDDVSVERDASGATGEVSKDSGAEANAKNAENETNAENAAGTNGSAQNASEQKSGTLSEAQAAALAEKIATAKRLLQNGFSVEDTAKYSGLSVEQVQVIQLGL